MTTPASEAEVRALRQALEALREVHTMLAPFIATGRAAAWAAPWAKRASDSISQADAARQAAQ